MPKKLLWLFIIYFVLLVIYTIFSYALTAPNLILSSNEVFWRFQTWMWQTFFNDRELLTYIYLAIITLIFLIYFMTLTLIKNMKTVGRNSYFSSWFIFGVILLMAFPLLFSNNALSYDVFNYIFNAKMVLIYHADPHVKVALDFAFDDWTRFMHNTHTPAPYGYGWTVLSLIPYTLGLGKFLLTWTVFRLFGFISFILLFFTYQWFNHKKNRSWSFNSYFLIFLNPLLLIEVISNSHNDLWMMVPAIISLTLVANSHRQKTTLTWLKIILSIFLLGFSISTKFATILLLPVWIGLMLNQSLQLKTSFVNFRNNWPLLSSLAMFLPLCLNRSQQFHPWYLIWSLVWIPLFSDHKLAKFWQQGLIVLSISSLYRYLPYLWLGEYNPEVLWQQKLITWLPFTGFLAWSLLRTLINRPASIKA